MRTMTIWRRLREGWGMVRPQKSCVSFDSAADVPFSFYPIEIPTLTSTYLRASHRRAKGAFSSGVLSSPGFFFLPSVHRVQYSIYIDRPKAASALEWPMSGIARNFCHSLCTPRVENLLHARVQCVPHRHDRPRSLNASVVCHSMRFIYATPTFALSPFCPSAIAVICHCHQVPERIFQPVTAYCTSQATERMRSFTCEPL